jgi:hypothetical protein
LIFDSAQILAFRLHAHNLAARLRAGSLLTAAACGIQDTPPGSAALALHARLSQLAPEYIDRALAVDKSLIHMWSMRAAPYAFPTTDAAVFTLGVLPTDEESLRFFILGAIPALDRIGISATELVQRTGEAVIEALDERELTKDGLGLEVANQLERRLNPQQLTGWRLPSWYAEGQGLGESAVRFALSILSLQGILCFAPRKGRSAATFIRTDQWLGAPLPHGDPARARAELVRRYLSCYGPSTQNHFAQWAGVSREQAADSWNLVSGELVAVDLGGRVAWLREPDLPHLESPPAPEGVRLLPPHDPYLQLRDRETLAPDEELQRRLWRSSGNPGVVLVNGWLVGLWRSQKQGKRLKIHVEQFVSLSNPVRSAVEAEGETLALFKGCESVDVSIL